MRPVEPVLTIELFPRLSLELLALLRGLSRSDWEKPTACSLWSVKDVAAHLLGGNLGRLSDYHDRPSQLNAPMMTYKELVNVIDQENAEWVKSAKRISSRLLIEFLDLTDRQLYQFFKTFRDDEPAMVPVSWAGDNQSPSWFDIAREYTEKWLHQQHIREAVEQPLLVTRQWLFPVLDTFMRALPHTYRMMDAQDGAIVTFNVVGEAGGNWSLVRQNGAWLLFSGTSSDALTSVSLTQDLAWRLFTKGVSREIARAQIQIEGDNELGLGILHMVSIMA